MRTAAHRALNRAAQHQAREFAVDPLAGGLDESASEDPGPEQELIAQEDKGEMVVRPRGQVLERRWKSGRGYAIRFYAYGPSGYEHGP
ncbi:MAG TPA: hypothetical protein VKC63_11355 [Solirubrobacterales bacterium]|nr:hypothetical protein [Solirubrobacterales bacterium]